MNLGNWYGISAYVSSNLGFGTSMQLTPWITYGEDIFGIDGFSFNPGGKFIDEWIKEFLTELFGG